MYGFWRLGLSPFPSSGVGCVVNGDATNTSKRPKKVATAARIGTVHGRTSRTSRRLSARAAEPTPVRTSSQRRSDPACPLQKAASV
jgi:hypothetical protein